MIVEGLYATSSMIESSVPVTGGKSPLPIPVWANVASVTVPGLAAGDWLLVGFDLEASVASSITYNTALTTQVVCGLSVGDSRQYVVRAKTTNITPAIHHEVPDRTSPFLVVVPEYNVLTLQVAADADAAGADDVLGFDELPDPGVYLWAMRVTGGA